MTGRIDKPDPRILRSTSAFRSALLQLLSQSPFHSITITDIVKLAGYNRGTFYANYENKEALLHDVISGLIGELLQAYRAPYEHERVFRIAELHADSIKIFEHISTHANLYTVLVKSDVLPVLREAMFTSLKRTLREEIVHGEQDVDHELAAIYSIHALLGLIFHWIEEGYPHSVSYMQEQLLKIVTRHPPEVRTTVKRGDRTLGSCYKYF
jgi:AcrR family transcriptional regulator